MRKILRIAVFFIYILLLLEISSRVFLYLSLNNYLNKVMEKSHADNVKEFCQISFWRGRNAPFAHFRNDPVCYSLPRDGRFFRGPQDQIAYPEKRLDKDEIRILCIGDSTTFNICVDYYHSWPYILETLLKKRYPGRPIKVLNAGIPGGIARQIKRIFQFHLAKYEPDIILYKCKCFLSDTYLVKRPVFPFGYWGWRIVQSSRLYRLSCILIDMTVRKKTDSSAAEAVYDFFHGIDRQEKIDLAKKSSEFKTDFDVIKKISSFYGTKYVVAIEYIGREQDEISGNYKCLKDKDVAHIVPLARVFNEKIKTTSIDEIFTDVCHMTEEGTEMMAREVFKYLTKNCSDVFTVR